MFSLCQGPSPELREEEEHEGEVEEDEEEEEFKLFKVKRSNSKTMKVIPSPVSTLERRLFDGDNHQVTMNNWKVNDVRRHKRSNSEEEIEKNKKGFFSVSFMIDNIILLFMSQSICTCVFLSSVLPTLVGTGRE